MLDVRDGYTVADVAAACSAWGPAGRRLYLGIEAIDASVYVAAYRGLGVVVINRWGGP